MAREREDFRPTLEQLNEKFPDRFWLTRADVAAFLGVSTRTVSRRLPLLGYATKYSKVELARRLSL